MATDVYVKTALGIQELGSRKVKLPNRLRCMFILIDGIQPVAALKIEAEKLGAPDDFIEQLAALDLIAKRSDVADATAVTITVPTTTATVTIGGAAQASSQDEFSRFRAAKDFMSTTVVDALGIKSFFFTLKLEKAATRADLGELLLDYSKAMSKSLGPEAAQVMIGRLERMLR
jgi:hypothetical protein